MLDPYWDRPPRALTRLYRQQPRSQQSPEHDPSQDVAHGRAGHAHGHGAKKTVPVQPPSGSRERKGAHASSGSKEALRAALAASVVASPVAYSPLGDKSTTQQPGNSSSMGRLGSSSSSGSGFFAGNWLPPPVTNPKLYHNWLPNDTYCSSHLALGVELSIRDESLSSHWH